VISVTILIFTVLSCCVKCIQPNNIIVSVLYGLRHMVPMMIMNELDNFKPKGL